MPLSDRPIAGPDPLLLLPVSAGVLLIAGGRGRRLASLGRLLAHEPPGAHGLGDRLKPARFVRGRRALGSPCGRSGRSRLPGRRHTEGGGLRFAQHKPQRAAFALDRDGLPRRIRSSYEEGIAALVQGRPGARFFAGIVDAISRALGGGHDAPQFKGGVVRRIPGGRGGAGGQKGRSIDELGNAARCRKQSESCGGE